MNLLKSFTASIVHCSAAHVASLLVCLAVATMAASIASPAHADDASCAPLRKIETGMMHMTYRQTTQVTGRPPHDIIATPAAIYIKTPAGWSSAGASPAMRKRLTHMFGISLTNCHRLRTDSVDGQSAEVYTVTSHEGGGDQGTKALIWLAKSNHLPLKVEADVQTSGATRHVSTRYEYDNVHAPADAKREFSLDSLFGRHH